MSWDFARTLKWVIRHVLVVVLVVVMVNLGFWQLRRLDEKRDHKHLVEARQELPVERIQAVYQGPIEADVRSEQVDEVLYRSVVAEGSYYDERTVVVENRTLDGISGGWVLTPLMVGGDAAVIVNRGFIALDRDGRVVAPPAPTGPVRVEGLLLPSQHRGSFGARDPEQGVLTVMARVDLERMAEQLPNTGVYPAYIQLVEGDPPEPPPAPDAPQIQPLGEPELSEGPHLSYAVQWFIFSTIAAGGYGLLLRKVAQEEATARRVGAAAEP